ncbi:MAG: hypothetical protein ACKOW9_01505 [Candidatus Paceibacterota bacterium]
MTSNKQQIHSPKPASHKILFTIALIAIALIYFASKSSIPGSKENNMKNYLYAALDFADVGSLSIGRIREDCNGDKFCSNPVLSATAEPVSLLTSASLEEQRSLYCEALLTSYSPLLNSYTTTSTKIEIVTPEGGFENPVGADNRYNKCLSIINSPETNVGKILKFKAVTITGNVPVEGYLYLDENRVPEIYIWFGK